MREAAFIKQNKEKWNEIETQGYSNPDADDLADNFIELTDDLSYARTFYPNSQTEKYLNRLTSKYFIGIYKYRKGESGRFFRFWKEELPEVMYRQRKNMLYSFLFFMLGIVIGVFSASQDDSFVRLILGDSYVNMTLQNIDKGDPMAVYKSSDSAPMFFGIATNNIRVAFLAFIFGIIFSVGAVYILFGNGVMLGAFQYFFYQKGLLGTSMLSIWLHGTLEISAIVIAGGAGLVLGNALLFPGTYSRAYSLRKAAKEALTIVIGLVPVFVVAAFIESYWTRLTDMPAVFNLTIIILSAAFIIGYFFWYPYYLNNMKNKKYNKTNQ